MIKYNKSLSEIIYNLLFFIFFIISLRIIIFKELYDKIYIELLIFISVELTLTSVYIILLKKINKYKKIDFESWKKNNNTKVEKVDKMLDGIGAINTLSNLSSLFNNGLIGILGLILILFLGVFIIKYIIIYILLKKVLYYCLKKVII